MDASLKQRLSSQISQGRVVLFTGAGFSLGNRSRQGLDVPTSEQLRRELWGIAFSDHEIDGSPLGDVFRAAQRVAGNRTRDLLTARLTIDHSQVPLHYGIWFRQPWRRMYTLNIDDLDEAANRAYSLPRKIVSLSAMGGPVPGDSPDLQSIHLNGRIADYPDVVFSPRDYGRRAAEADPWYGFLAAELTTNPVVFVGTVLDESPLWQHLELRRMGRSMKGAPLPGSYLVAPQLPLARQRLLEEFNVAFVEMSAEDFAIDVLQALEAASQSGLKRLSVIRSPESHRGSPLRAVSELRRSRVEDPGAFLLGREPDWADIVHGFAVSRSFEGGLFEQIRERGCQAFVFSGTAGSGKSTSLRRLALAADAEGLSVQFVERESGASLRAIQQAILDSQCDVVVMDDMEVYGSGLVPFIADVHQETDAPLVLGAMKGTRFEALRVEPELEAAGVRVGHVAVPLLEDRDIDLLLDALDRANRLGRLKARPREEQRHEFEVRCGRQLLVAMIETTSGEDFKEKIRRECSELESPLSAIYPIVCLASSQDVGLSRDEAVLAASNLDQDAAYFGLQRLHAQHLLIQRNDLYYVRHGVVANQALTYYRLEGQIRQPLTGLLHSLAIKWSPDLQRNHRVNRLLSRLLSHTFMARITDSGETPQIAYNAVEDLLKDNHHYWLQRGNYELDYGRLELAHNFLDQAKQLAPSDSFVRVSWAHKTLRRAADTPSDPDSDRLATGAIEDLFDVIGARGSRDTTPYHVLGSQGLHWFRRKIVSSHERAESLKWLEGVVSEGALRHPGSKELQQLASDLKRAYLELALPPDQRSL